MFAYPHIDISGRGLDDGECELCGMSGSLEDFECPARLREALDDAHKAHLRDIMPPRYVLRCRPMPAQNPKCARCDGPTAWQCGSDVWSMGVLSCEWCGAGAGLLIRQPDHEVYLLPPDTQTHNKRLARQARAERSARLTADKLIASMRAFAEGTEPVKCTVSPGPLYDAGLAAATDLIRHLMRELLAGDAEAAAALSGSPDPAEVA
jgi:hypothetical protein